MLARSLDPVGIDVPRGFVVEKLFHGSQLMGSGRRLCRQSWSHVVDLLCTVSLSKEYSKWGEQVRWNINLIVYLL